MEISRCFHNFNDSMVERCLNCLPLGVGSYRRSWPRQIMPQRMTNGWDTESMSRSPICFSELGYCGKPLIFTFELQAHKIERAVWETNRRERVIFCPIAWKSCYFPLFPISVKKKSKFITKWWTVARRHGWCQPEKLEHKTYLATKKQLRLTYSRKDCTFYLQVTTSNNKHMHKNNTLSQHG